jgi:hypothetical protein
MPAALCCPAWWHTLRHEHQVMPALIRDLKWTKILVTLRKRAVSSAGGTGDGAFLIFILSFNLPVHKVQIILWHI